MKLQKTYIIGAALCVLTAASSCSDHLFDDFVNTSLGEEDGMQFAVGTAEMADLLIGVGDTRAAAHDSLRNLRQQADHFLAHPLAGDDTHGLQVHRMPLPYVGIHSGTAHATLPAADDHTRAPLSEIADSENFHDSLTVWGYAYNATTHEPLFNKTLLKKIRNWRTFVQWPYGKGEHMQFFTISPALESLNLNVATEPGFIPATDDEPAHFTPPVFTYTLPETAGEMRDLLYGTGHVESIEAGPAGSTTSNPKAENLGKDNKLIDLQFHHILTAIRFAQGNIPTGITIKRISLNDVIIRGTYNPADSDAPTGTLGEWSTASSAIKGSYTLTTNFPGGGSTPNTYIDNNQVLFMIPHTLSENATLEIEIEAPQHYTVDENGVYTPYDGERKESDGATTRTHTLTCSLTGDVWKKGYTVTYLLTIGQVSDGYYLIAESPEAHPHSSTTTSGHFNLHSYRSYWDYTTGSENTTHAVPWKVVGYSNEKDGTFNEGNKPAWLLDGLAYNVEQTGGHGTTVNYTLLEQTATKGENHATILQENKDKAPSNMDLSWYSPNLNKFSTQQPANCYIINRPGTYTFPTYYGNKTTNGAENAVFKDHAGATITHYNIGAQLTDNTLHPTTITNTEETERTVTGYAWTSQLTLANYLRATIVWQESDGLITNLSVVPDHNEIGFTPDDGKKIKPCNTVIALQGRKVITHEKKDGEGNWVVDTSKGSSGYEATGDWETFWTWHIWMTDEVYPNDGSNNTYNKSKNEMFLNYNPAPGHSDHVVTLYDTDGETETIMPVNLGWVPDDNDFVYYSHREVWVKLQQVVAVAGVSDENSQTCVVKIEQHARQPLVTGTSTVYQWGRPTALPALCHTDKSTRTPYMGTDFSSETFTQEDIGLNHPEDIIARPTKLLRTSGDSHTWFNNTSVPSYWGDGTPAGKTVYDPCPPGFYIPGYGIFTGFSRTGETAFKGSSLNMWEDAGEHKKGAYFYTTPNTTSTTADRYGQTVYLPASGQYNATNVEGTATSNLYIDADAGLAWSYDWNSSSKRGNALWFYPDWGRDNSDKPAIQLPRPIYFSTALPVRPAGTPPAY